MTLLQKPGDNIYVRLAETGAEVEAAQSVRYKVFYEERGADATPEMATARRDIDAFDPIADHLIVVDTTLGDGPDGIVGTYRLLRREAADRYGGFYTSDEYDIKQLLSIDGKLLELGRSCVLPDYRTRPVMQLLWKGIAGYLAEHDIALMFGCASFLGRTSEPYAEGFSYLHHYHLAPEELRPVAHPSRYIKMDTIAAEDLNAKRVFASLPPLIKGYLRLGATIGEGAVVDYPFNTIDVCIVLPTHLVTSRYLRHYGRSSHKPLPIQSSFAEKNPVMARGTS